MLDTICKLDLSDPKSTRYIMDALCILTCQEMHYEGSTLSKQLTDSFLGREGNVAFILRLLNCEQFQELAVCLLMNSRIQSYFVSQDDFKLIFSVMNTQGYSHTGSVVGLCLRLIINLIDNHPSNQAVFLQGMLILR